MSSDNTVSDKQVLISDDPLFFAPLPNAFPNYSDPVYKVVVSDAAPTGDSAVYDQEADAAIFQGKERLEELSKMAQQKEEQEAKMSSFTELTLREIFEGMSNTFTDLLVKRTRFFSDGDANTINRRYVYVGVLIIITTLALSLL